MKFMIGSDQVGYELKEKVKAYLLEKGHRVGDLGTTDVQAPLPYSEVAHNVHYRIREGGVERGLLICGTGAGMCIHANKHQGISAMVSESVYSARLCGVISDTDIFVFGSRVVSVDITYKMADVFIKTEFIEGMGLEHTEHLMSQ